MTTDKHTDCGHCATETCAQPEQTQPVAAPALPQGLQKIMADWKSPIETPDQTQEILNLRHVIAVLFDALRTILPHPTTEVVTPDKKKSALIDQVKHNLMGTAQLGVNGFQMMRGWEACGLAERTLSAPAPATPVAVQPTVTAGGDERDQST